MNTGTEILSSWSVICLDGSDRCSVIWTQAHPVRLCRFLDENCFKLGTVSVYVYRRDSFCNGSKMSFSYWSCFLCIDCEPLDNTRICQTDDDVWRLGDSPHCDTNMCQDVRPLEASHMCHSHQPPVSCQKHLKLGKQWTPQHNANNWQPLPPHQTRKSTTVYHSIMIFKNRCKNHWPRPVWGPPECWVITHAQWDTIMLIDWCLDTL